MERGHLWEKLKELGNTSGIKIIQVNANDLIFEEHVHLNCFYCGRYGNNWRCPPHIPKIDYPKMFTEFNNLAFVYNRYEITPQNRDSVRTDSTNHLHKSLLALEKVIYENGMSTAISFLGGSCKLCKNGCSPDKCSTPYTSRIPLEATGMNIEKTASKYGIEVAWPIAAHILRIGMLLW